MIKKIIIFSCFFLSLFVVSSVLAAEKPWFTGPLFAESAKTIPAGHTNYEPYFFYVDHFGRYDKRWKKKSAVRAISLIPTIIIIHGLSPSFDLELFLPYFIKQREGRSDAHVGDASLALGYQLLLEKRGTWIPDVRLTVGERFPTGRYQYLNPEKNETDASGEGAYQTRFGVHFEKLWSVLGGHFLSVRLSTNYIVPHSIRVHDFNTFGGGFNTNAKFALGNFFSADLAFEYTLTQHWVPVVEIIYASNASNSFTGDVGVTPTGLPAMLSTHSTSRLSLAPAIEYNFTSHLGIIAGSWFSIAGRNIRNFKSVVFALNYFD